MDLGKARRERVNPQLQYVSGLWDNEAMKRIFLALVLLATLFQPFQYVAKAEDSKCASEWKLTSWWSQPIILKYAPIINQGSATSQYKLPVTSIVYAPQLSTEAIQKIASEGKEIAIQFYISRKNDLNFDEAFRPIYRENANWNSDRKYDAGTIFSDIPRLNYPNKYSLFPNASISTKIEVAQPNCKLFTISSDYSKNGNYQIPKISSTIWDEYWKNMTANFQVFQEIKKWESTFLSVDLKPLTQESSVGSNKWYEIMPPGSLFATSFEWDWASCNQVKVLGEFEKDFNLRNGINFTPWEMIFLESPIYGVAGLSITKPDQPVKCNVGLYLMVTEWYGPQSPVLFDLGKKDVTIPAKLVVPTQTPSPKAKVSTKSSSITCIKGKIVKKVSGINPKCPSGYKRK
jgi:hypothetical protein